MVLEDRVGGEETGRQEKGRMSSRLCDRKTNKKKKEKIHSHDFCNIENIYNTIIKVYYNILVIKY